MPWTLRYSFRTIAVCIKCFLYSLWWFLRSWYAISMKAIVLILDLRTLACAHGCKLGVLTSTRWIWKLKAKTARGLLDAISHCHIEERPCYVSSHLRNHRKQNEAKPLSISQYFEALLQYAGNSWHAYGVTKYKVVTVTTHSKSPYNNLSNLHLQISSPLFLGKQWLYIP